MLKLQYFGHLLRRANSLEKILMLGKIEGRRRRGQHVQLCVTPWTAVHQAPLSSILSHSLLKFMSIVSVMASNHLILCHPLLLLPSIFPSIRIFSSESDLHIRWPKYWSFSISPFNEYSGFIPFRIDWYDLLAVNRCQ